MLGYPKKIRRHGLVLVVLMSLAVLPISPGCPVSPAGAAPESVPLLGSGTVVEIMVEFSG